jgi:ribosomal protein L16 Arg81 hydroxylase
LEDLIGNVEIFMREYWNAKPLHHPIAKIGKVRALLSVNTLDAILGECRLREPYIRMARPSGPVNSSRYLRPHRVSSTSLTGVMDVSRVASEFSRGATILLDGIDHYHSGIKSVCEALIRALNGPADAVAIITPRGAQGLATHYENTEVFVIQLHGSKTWKIYNQIKPLPMSAHVVDAGVIGNIQSEFTLQEGDCLYVPWGSPHAAFSRDTMSCHISIQVRPQTWEGAISRIVREIVSAKGHKSIPLFTANTLDDMVLPLRAALSELAEFVALEDLDALLSTCLNQQSGVSADRSGFIRQMDLRTRLSETSRLWRNETVPFNYYIEASETVRVRSGSVVLSYPRHAVPILQVIEERQSFYVRELIPELGLETVLKALKPLIDHGALEIRE